MVEVVGLRGEPGRACEDIVSPLKVMFVGRSEPLCSSIFILKLREVILTASISWSVGSGCPEVILKEVGCTFERA